MSMEKFYNILVCSNFFQNLAYFTPDYRCTECLHSKRVGFYVRKLSYINKNMEIFHDKIAKLTLDKYHYCFRDYYKTSLILSYSTTSFSISILASLSILFQFF